MLDAVDDHFRSLEASDALDAMDEFYSRAYTMISSKVAREAFNLKAEPEAIRKKYGETPVGMRLLLCRRLAEAGVRFVSRRRSAAGTTTRTSATRWSRSAPGSWTRPTRR